MVSIRKLLACTAAATAAMGSEAFAESAPPMVAPAVFVQPQARPALAGYVDLMLGYGWGWELNLEQGDPTRYEDRWRELSFRGAGRAANYLTPGFGIQFEAWTKLFVGHTVEFEDDVQVDEFDFWFAEGGVGTHLIIGAPGGFQGGLVASVGLPGNGLWANIGADVAATFGNFRVSGQAGFSFGVFGDAQFDVERDIYVTAGAAFYPTPNLSIGAHVGWDRFTENFGGGDEDTFTGINYGFRAERQLGNSPFAIHLAYQAFRWNGFDDDETWTGIERVVTAGVRLLLGGDTLQEVDALVPFADRNPIYGDPFAPR